MRSILVAALLPLAANAFDCGSSPPPVEPQANVQASVSANAAAAPIAASRGGKVVLVGQANLEVVVKSDGLVQAYPIAAAGAAAAGAAATVSPAATVKAQVATTAGSSAPVQLTWNAGGYFEGRVVNAVPRPGEISVSVVDGGRAEVTGQASAAPVVVVPARGGTLVDVGPAKAEVVVATSGVVQVIPAFPTVEAAAAIPATATVDADIAIEGGATDTVSLAWNPALFVYEGRVAAGRTVARGATVVRVVNAGARVEARAPTVVLLPPSALVVAGPQFGGTVVDVDGGAKLEVLAGVDGRVVARPLATCVTTPRLENGATVSVEVVGAGGVKHTVPLVWDETRGSFQGRAEANARFDQNVDADVVVVRPNLPPARGHATGVVVLPAATFDARFTLVAPTVQVDTSAVADVNARANAQGQRAQAEAARVRAEAEAAAARVRASVQPPTVRVGVSGSASAGAGGSASSSGSRSSSSSSSGASGSASGGIRIGGGVMIGR